jgi:hypothetical protein
MAASRSTAADARLFPPVCGALAQALPLRVLPSVPAGRARAWTLRAGVPSVTGALCWRQRAACGRATRDARRRHVSSGD